MLKLHFAYGVSSLARAIAQISLSVWYLVLDWSCPYKTGHVSNLTSFLLNSPVATTYREGDFAFSSKDDSKIKSLRKSRNPACGLLETTESFMI